MKKDKHKEERPFLKPLKPPSTVSCGYLGVFFPTESSWQPPVMLYVMIIGVETHQNPHRYLSGCNLELFQPPGLTGVISGLIKWRWRLVHNFLMGCMAPTNARFCVKLQLHMQWICGLSLRFAWVLKKKCSLIHFFDRNVAETSNSLTQTNLKQKDLIFLLKFQM